jgi:Helix-turn-helix of insertion element transposase
VRWTKPKERAALLLSEDRLTDEEIAADLGIRRRTLAYWKDDPEFAARVAEHVEAFRKAVRSRGIACLENRVDALSDRWKRMQRVITERAEELEGECAGGGTGLLVRQVKSVGSGPLAREVEEFAVDTGLLKELREHEKQAAQELGQWTERRDVTSAGEAIAYLVLPPGESGDSEPGDAPGGPGEPD